MKIRERVWSLWPTTAEMALDLGESVIALARAEKEGKLPDPRHDFRILLRAKGLGRRLTQEQLDGARKIRPLILLSERRSLIQDFYDAAGGVQEVMKAVPVSRAQLYVNKSRGHLNASTKAEFIALAERIGFKFPEQIFNRPAG
jgi:hypothetical protein